MKKQKKKEWICLKKLLMELDRKKLEDLNILFKDKTRINKSY